MLEFEIDRSPIEIPWTVNSADDWWETFTVKQNGVAVDVSTWVWGGSVVAKRNSDLVVVSIEWDTSEAATGQISFGVNYPDTIVPRGSYWYELDVATPKRTAFQCGVLTVGFDHSELEVGP